MSLNIITVTLNMGEYPDPVLKPVSTVDALKIRFLLKFLQNFLGGSCKETMNLSVSQRATVILSAL